MTVCSQMNCDEEATETASYGRSGIVLPVCKKHYEEK